MTTPIRILGIAGSLRRDSYNRAALRAAAQLVPADASLDIFDLDGIPLSTRTRTGNHRHPSLSSRSASARRTRF